MTTISVILDRKDIGNKVRCCQYNLVDTKSKNPSYDRILRKELMLKRLVVLMQVIRTYWKIILKIILN